MVDKRKLSLSICISTLLFTIAMTVNPMGLAHAFYDIRSDYDEDYDYWYYNGHCRLTLWVAVYGRWPYGHNYYIGSRHEIKLTSSWDYKFEGWVNFESKAYEYVGGQYVLLDSHSETVPYDICDGQYVYGYFDDLDFEQADKVETYGLTWFNAYKMMYFFGMRIGWLYIGQYSLSARAYVTR